LKKTLAILLLGCLCATAELVPFYNGGGYTRDEQVNPSWWVTNDLAPSRLYLNGVYQSQETGTNDLGLTVAWKIQTAGCQVGILADGAHGARVVDCFWQTVPVSFLYQYPLSRWYADAIAAGIEDCVSNGCRIVVVPGGIVPNQDTLEALLGVLLNHPDVLVVWAAPNTSTASMDTELVEYPYRWNLPNVLTVNSTDRNGNWYPTATGTNCVAAPGRNIVAAGTYSSGTSYAAPIVAGIASLVWSKYPWLTAERLANTLRATATVTGPVRRINPVAALCSQPVAVYATEELEP
jgi:subtilisin family serine protease